MKVVAATAIVQMTEASCLTRFCVLEDLADARSAAVVRHNEPAYRNGKATPARSSLRPVEGKRRSNNDTAIGPPMLFP
jgi:hypothetical protein